MISEERIKTNLLLIDDLNYWDELTFKKDSKNNHENTYFVELMRLINRQLDESIQWLDSQDAKDFFYGETKYQRDVFNVLESQWDRILSGIYETVEDILEEVYDYGKIQGYSDIAEKIRYTDADKLALTQARNYNYNLIRKLDGELKRTVKNRIFQAVVSGEHPYQLASKLVDLGVTPLPNSTLSPRQRANMIARTEVARAQNTGILQSYVNEGYDEVKILTAEDENVCYLCLKNAYEFDDNAKIIYGNHGNEIVHNIKSLIKNKQYVPLHPNCYSKDTQIYTNHGWKYFYDINENDKILSLNPETKETEFLDYVKIISHENNYGYLYHIYNRWFDIYVTPDHDCFIYQRKEIKGKRINVPEFRKPYELNSESKFLRTIENHNVSPEYINVNGLQFKSQDYAFLMAWYLSEGNVLHDYHSAKRRGYPIKISQEKSYTRKVLTNELKRICDYLGLKLIIGKSYFEIHSKELHDYLLPLGYCHEMYVPQELFDLSKEDLQLFLENYILGDGHSRKSNNNLVQNSHEETIITSSINLVNDLSYIILLAGYYPSISLSSKKGTISNHHNGKYASNYDCYCLRINRSKFTQFNNCKVEKIPYNDKVYCVELPKYHSIWIQRKGKTSWNGNCRCTYLSVWKRNRTPPKNPYTVNLTNEESHNWSYNHKGKKYQLQGNTPLSRHDFLEKYGIEVDKLSPQEELFLKIFTKDSSPLNNYLRFGPDNLNECTDKWKSINLALIERDLVSGEMDFKIALTIAESIFNKYCKTVDEDIILCRRERERFMGRNGKKTYEDKGFTSMSIHEFAKADKYGDELNYILIPKGTKILYVEGITSSPRDYETLFLPGIHLDHVEDVSSKKKVWRLP